jgi:F420-non-reducing hydrogenase small subunit
MSSKRTLSVYWASSCGGCEVALLNLHERLLQVEAAFQLVFCPCLVDTKIKDVQAMADGAIDVTLFNGSIRTQENLDMAHLLRRKSRLLVAFGACATSGGVPALSNLRSAREHIDAAYRHDLSTENPNGVLPQEWTPVPEGELVLPRFFERVRTLAQTVHVDCVMPGCPPASDQIWTVVDRLIQGAPLPPAGASLDTGQASVCAECGRTRRDKTIARLHRTYEIVPDATACLLDQGLVCLGVATRGGCGAPCPQVNMPCIGCYGPPEGVHDQTVGDLAQARTCACAHDTSLATALDIGRFLDIPLPPVIRVWGVEPADTGTFGEALTCEVSRAVPRVAAEIIASLESDGGDGAPS